jgi:hypothetical protein
MLRMLPVLQAVDPGVLADPPGSEGLDGGASARVRDQTEQHPLGGLIQSARRAGRQGHHPMNAGLTIQDTTGLHSLSTSPWAGLGVLAAWAAAALLTGRLVLRLREDRPVKDIEPFLGVYLIAVRGFAAGATGAVLAIYALARWIPDPGRIAEADLTMRTANAPRPTSRDWDNGHQGARLG